MYTAAEPPNEVLLNLRPPLDLAVTSRCAENNSRLKVARIGFRPSKKRKKWPSGARPDAAPSVATAAEVGKTASNPVEHVLPCGPCSQQK